MSLFLKSCPRCGGDVWENPKGLGFYYVDPLYCLQCGHRPGISILPERAPGREKAGPIVRELLVSFFNFILYNKSQVHEHADRVIELINVVNKDLYTATAAVMSNTPTDQVSKLERLRVKNLLYKFIYEAKPQNLKEWILAQ